MGRCACYLGETLPQNQARPGGRLFQVPRLEARSILGRGQALLRYPILAGFARIPALQATECALALQASNFRRLVYLAPGPGRSISWYCDL